ncbi:MAG: class I SAM-dependent rRNA methyltransferase [Planctomycetota bacterium]|nr:MAG: class I SAM-dependent rRNA methyltransferase [Planctomycetota bacterium]
MTQPHRELVVGRQSAGFIRRGHPWLRRDRFTRGLESLSSGEAVTLVDEQGRGLASALIDRDHESICARVYHRLPGKSFEPLSALQRAWQRRADLRADGQTTCYRLLHGEGDFLPGLRMDILGDWLLVYLRSQVLAARVDALAAQAADLAGISPERAVIRSHLEDERRAPSQARLLDGSAIDDSLRDQAQELGVPLWIEPCSRLACGIYVDQRATRQWLIPHCQQARVLNLFAYSGLFSTCLLQHGAELALSVDAAGPALEMAQANAKLAGVADRHRCVRSDARSFCAADQDRYDIIICDPPTAAHGSGNKVSQGWVAQRDYPLLLEQLRPRLNPGGMLIAVINTLGRPYDLRRAVESAGFHALPANQGPSLGEDLPQIAGFPEGRPYHLVVAKL